MQADFLTCAVLRCSQHSFEQAQIIEREGKKDCSLHLMSAQMSGTYNCISLLCVYAVKLPDSSLIHLMEMNTQLASSNS